MILADTGYEFDRILADPLAAARKAGVTLGYVGTDVPEDLIAAPGRGAMHLPWDAGLDTPLAGDWLESGFAPWTRSTLELWAQGAFDFLEFVIFSRGDDSAQRLYYYVCELQRRGKLGGPAPLVFDIARVPRSSSRAYTVSAVRRLAAALDVDRQAMAEGVRAANRRRGLYAGIDRAREGPGSVYERVARAGLYADIDDVLRQFRAEPFDARGRVLLGGSVPPDDRLHRAVEAAGWTVCGEAHDNALLRRGPEVVVQDADPFAAVGSHAHALAVGPRRFLVHGEALLDEVRRVRAEAVIHWLIDEDEARAWHVPAQRRVLGEAGVPALFMTRRRWDAADGAAEEIGRFLEGVSG